MSGNSWGTTFLSLLLAGSLGYLAWWLEIGRLHKELTEAQVSIKNTKDALENAQNQIRIATQAATQFENLCKRLTDLNDESQKLPQSLYDVVIEVRAKAIGIPVPELKLSDGATLSNVKIQSIGDLDVTVAHSTGVAHLSWKSLPPAWVARFRLNDPVLLALKAALDLQNPVKKSSDQPLAESSPFPKINHTLVRELENKITNVQTEINLLRAQQNSLQNKASDFRRLAANASVLHRTNSHMISAHQADDQAAAIGAQIITLKGQETRLQQELSRANAGHQ